MQPLEFPLMFFPLVTGSPNFFQRFFSTVVGAGARNSSNRLHSLPKRVSGRQLGQCLHHYLYSARRQVRLFVELQGAISGESSVNDDFVLAHIRPPNCLILVEQPYGCLIDCSRISRRSPPTDSGLHSFRVLPAGVQLGCGQFYPNIVCIQLICPQKKLRLEHAILLAERKISQLTFYRQLIGDQLRLS